MEKWKLAGKKCRHMGEPEKPDCPYFFGDFASCSRMSGEAAGIPKDMFCRITEETLPADQGKQSGRKPGNRKRTGNNGGFRDGAVRRNDSGI